MYRQIALHPDHWKFQRILWKNNTNNIVAYQLTTVTYGLGCAPFLALRVLLQLIEDEGAKFPSAISTLTRGRYVDDVFGGADSVEEAQVIVQQVHQLCMAGGFRLQKWTTNSHGVLDAIPVDLQLHTSKIAINEDFIVHSLGLSWQPITDNFLFSSQVINTENITKRIILSTIAKLFDPLGLLSPMLVTAKIIIQELWTLKLEWDDPIPASLANKWCSFVHNLQNLSTLTFPRWLGCTAERSLELHGFADASHQAFAAVIYIRSSASDGQIVTQLICSKTKVAPLKRQTIPRLELAGATLLTKLMMHVLKSLNRQSISVYLWIDSSVAYTWITNHPSRWRDFVHNRVCYIQTSLPQACWGLVSGSANPADLATRGVTPKQLKLQPSWWNGPSWLAKPSHTWPKHLPSISKTDNLEERSVNVSTIITKPTECWELLRRYSSLNRLLRITATIQRIIKRFRRKSVSSESQPLTPSELQEAKSFWIKQTQNSSFQHEITLISNGESLPPSHTLRHLTPFVDVNGLLRVGGRLQSSLLPTDAEHPIILPKESLLTNLIISDAHQRSLHGGTQITLALLREEFWLIGGRVPVRKHILRCIRCARFRQKRAQQLMGQLPKARVTPSRPFSHTGVDYAGPISLKTWRGRNARVYKSYIALFVCMATSAVHLELVTDYSTDAFIAAFKRFTGRRGICSVLFSDCGTTFKGANAELKQLFSKASAESERLATLLANDGTHWHFNPPSAPHFGGKWEAGVKSVKYHLHRVIGEALLTYEEMTTLLIQIEAVLNSRPLTPLSEDADDLTVLTPGHFLIGCAPTVLPEPVLDGIRTSHLSRWQLLRQMLNNFWGRWTKECLQRYQAVSKWQLPTPNLKKGAMVLVIDERFPPAKWPLGRIIDTHPGEDGQVRVVTVRTQLTTLKRPIVKLCPLPINEDIL